MSESRVEYGRIIDCALNGCDPWCDDNYHVYDFHPGNLAEYPVGTRLEMCGHACVVVQRTITISSWVASAAPDAFDSERVGSLKEKQP